ncbi:MAG: hypothetical protein ACTHJR_04650 [Sphingomonas sp.]|uniref:hypothetical protein n=1 Tax=Sphingomonas sp. TaxID=28214 RepID=UPI003F7EE706
MSKSLPEHLDDIANRTGIPALAARPQRRRPLRGLALVALILSTTGMAMACVAHRWLWIGEAVLLAGFFLSVWLPLKGPIKPWMSVEERVDERDAEVRARAYLTLLPIVLFIAMIGLAGIPALGWLQHRSAPETVALGGFGAFYLLTLWNSIPTLHASWQRAPADDEEEEG